MRKDSSPGEKAPIPAAIWLASRLQTGKILDLPHLRVKILDLHNLRRLSSRIQAPHKLRLQGTFNRSVPMFKHHTTFVYRAQATSSAAIWLPSRLQTVHNLRPASVAQ
ncbi:hypothetical protein AMTR_s00003p00121260 [Amborella trichopoda]|uniref:Uncharacterized protein n=1 Tax=Amborella trichopoda TaxID=13333 RepID=W1P016_AMBTC|nr:hypothetical protein AMTR_s00003p00121260 [Amborella trichopoda]